MFWRLGFFIGFSFIAALLGAWSTDRSSPIDVLKTEVLTPIVGPGGELCISQEFVRRESCRTRLQRVLVDSTRERYVMPDLELWAATGPLGRDVYKTCTPIPLKFAAGPASYRAVTEYVCNPLHNLWPVVRAADEVTFESKGEPRIGIPPIEVIPRR
jgi:hypothetical protein